MTVHLRSLADFRQFLAEPDARLQLIRHDNPAFQDRSHSRWRVRSVRKLQTNAVWFDTGELDGSWLYWDGKQGGHPASSFRFRDDVVTVDLAGDGSFASVFQYRCWRSDSHQPLFAACERPRCSPWGSLDQVEELAPGVWSVSTPSHGGVFLSAERNAVVPAYLRASTGWYEEDCDWSICALVHPDAFKFDHLAHADRSLKDWRPDEYERLTGNKLAPGESRQRDLHLWHTAHPGALLARSAFGDWAAWVPAGKVGVVAQATSTSPPWTPVGPERWFLVDASEYSPSASLAGFVVDPERHLEIPEPKNLHASKAA